MTMILKSLVYVSVLNVLGCEVLLAFLTEKKAYSVELNKMRIVIQ